MGGVEVNPDADVGAYARSRQNRFKSRIPGNDPHTKRHNCSGGKQATTHAGILPVAAEGCARPECGRHRDEDESRVFHILASFPDMGIPHSGHRPGVIQTPLS